MVEQRFNLILLPGMDGTGELFDEFLRLLPGWIEPRVVSYPRDQRLSYGQISLIVRSALPSEEPFAILAESFSTPLAIKVAAESPMGLQALVLCAGFISPPRRGLLGPLASLLAPALFAFGLPKCVCRTFLVGDAAPESLVDRVRRCISSVSSGVLAHRLQSVLACSAELEVRQVRVPLLYISGTNDRLVSETALREIRRARPDAQLASIEGPHLILQARPREAVDALVIFLRRVRHEANRSPAWE